MRNNALIVARLRLQFWRGREPIELFWICPPSVSRERPQEIPTHFPSLPPSTILSCVLSLSLSVSPNSSSSPSYRLLCFRFSEINLILYGSKALRFSSQPVFAFGALVQSNPHRRDIATQKIILSLRALADDQGTAIVSTAPALWCVWYCWGGWLFNDAVSR
jgi:hypothetical protein